MRLLSILILAVAMLSGCATRSHVSPETVEIRRAVAAPIASSPVGLSYGSQWPQSAPEIAADSAIMIDARSGRVLYEKNADQHRPVASTQKLLTAMLALEDGNLDEAIRIEPSDTMVEPSKLGIKSGEVYTKKQLLGAIMVKSSNDAAAALARNHSGSLAAFSMAMNARARELGASNSYFLNPHGLPAPGQFSTARDISRIAFHAYRNPVIRQYARTRYLPFTFSNGRTVRLETTNKLLARSPAFTGLKTGYTNASGRCLVTTARVGGSEVIIVQLGSSTRHIFDDAQRLVGWRGGNPDWVSMR